VHIPILILERRLGQVLAVTVKRPTPKGGGIMHLIADEMLPEWVSYNLSSAAQPSPAKTGVILSYL
jgi:hypothetical protein